MREVIDGVSDLVSVISLNFVNSPKCIPIAFPKVDVRPIHRHLVVPELKITVGTTASVSVPCRMVKLPNASAATWCRVNLGACRSIEEPALQAKS
jgi:hypothetical protein